LNSQVSIIMPCFNAGEYVATAIESVLQQNVPVQLIAVNDASTDNTAEILSRYSQDIDVLQSDDKGVAHARNKAIGYLNSRYTLLLDADDALAPGSLAGLLQKAGGDNRDVVCGNFSSWDGQMKKKLHLHKPPSLGRDPLNILVSRNISPPGAMLFPSDAFARAGIFDQSVAACEDWDFVIRLVRAGYRFSRLNREIFYYRRLPSSASNQVHRMLASGLEVVRRCHNPDTRVSGDLYAEGYDRARMEVNLLHYHAACMGLSSLSSDAESFSHILRSLKVPADPDWTGFGKTYRVWTWWNSLAIDGDQRALILAAQTRAVALIRQYASDEPWCRDMFMSILTPDFMDLLRRPGPGKALRLLREWKMAREMASKTTADT
jgi:glycosyltransferase involved in cell wall biosynthesis